jgi:glucokinase
MTGNAGGVLGVDIGGTKIAVGIVDRAGKILAQGRTPMVANGTPEAAFDAVVCAIDSMLSTRGTEIEGIGICAPGPLDREGSFSIRRTFPAGGTFRWPRKSGRSTACR